MNSFKTISGWGGYPKTNSEVISPRNIDEYKINLKKTFIARGKVVAMEIALIIKLSFKQVF